MVETMVDPVAGALAHAPTDDEPVTEEDRGRLRAGEAWFTQRGGHGIQMEEVFSEFWADA